MTKEKSLELVVRLNKYTVEYCSLEREKEITFRRYFYQNNYSRTAITTLYLRQSYIDTLIKKIVMLVRRLYRNEVDFENEVATMLFNEYDSQLRRFGDII